MVYDPVRYWQARENPNAAGHDRAPKFIYEYLRPRVAGKTNVLEVGPGVGRTLDVFDDTQNITTIDISTRYVEKISERASALGLAVSQFHLKCPRDLFPFDDDEFDVGVCVQVLMHVPPDSIEVTLGEMMRTCASSVIVATVDRGGKGKAAHVFEHDYSALVAKLGGEVTDYRVFRRAGCFTVRRA